jgi:hypothetical protein
MQGLAERKGAYYDKQTPYQIPGFIHPYCCLIFIHSLCSLRFPTLGYPHTGKTHNPGNRYPGSIVNANNGALSNHKYNRGDSHRILYSYPLASTYAGQRTPDQLH